MFKIYFILTPPLKEMPAKVFIDGNNYQWALLLCIILYCTQNNRIKLFRLNVLFCSFCTNTICSVKPLRHFVKLCCLGGEANNPLYTNGLSFSVLPQTAWTIMTEQEDSLGQAWSPPSPALFNIFHLRLIPTTFTQYTRYLWLLFQIRPLRNGYKKERNSAGSFRGA